MKQKDRFTYLIFEGEYLNWSKWKGITQKYYNGKLMYKLEYLDASFTKINDIVSKSNEL
mgnify:CR=1 FL=1